MLPTMTVVEDASVTQARNKIITFIKNDKVKKEMMNLGIDNEEAIQRLASLSNSEVKQLSGQIENRQAGGDFGIGSIVGAVVLVFLVLLVTDILGFTKVFPFTRSIKT